MDSFSELGGVSNACLRSRKRQNWTIRLPEMTKYFFILINRRESLKNKRYSFGENVGISSGTSGPARQCKRCKRHAFNPWVGKIPLRKAWQPIPVFFPGKSHGQRRLAGYSPQGPKELDVTEPTQHAPIREVILIQIFFHFFFLK